MGDSRRRRWKASVAIVAVGAITLGATAGCSRGSIKPGEGGSVKPGPKIQDSPVRYRRPLVTPPKPEDSPSTSQGVP